VEGLVLRANRQIRDQVPNRYSQHRRLLAVVLAILIAPMVVALPIAPGFAETPSADLPPGVGSLNDYMRQSGDGPSSTGVPPPAYQPYQWQAPPQNNFPQGVPPQENYRYADPNSARNALVGAAVVGALVVRIWALQEHEMHQADRRARKRFYAQRRAFPD
jgi:hypothetical protein